MENVFTKWNSISLVKRIIGGLILGTILGVTIPSATPISMLGILFTEALKGIAPVLVFFLVMSSLANQKQGVKSNMGHVVLLYMTGTLCAAFVAVVGSYLFPVTLTLTDAVDGAAAPENVSDVLRTLLINVVQNPVAAIANGNYIGILAWAVVFGIALKAASGTTKVMLGNISDAVSQAVRWIIGLAPFGIMGLVFSTVSENGVGIFTDYGKVVLLLVGCMVTVALVVNPIIVFINIRKNPYPLVFKCLKESFITAFFTRSSAANIPVNMELCKSLGLDEDSYSVSIPLGATVNMGGAAVTITVMTLAIVHTLGYSVDIGTAFVLSVVAAVSACGTSGVAGGSLLLIPLACSLFGIPDDIAMQVVGVGFIIGVIQDSCETGLNSSTDALFTAASEFRQWRKIGKKIEW